eukprot:TRINITY_DN3522_c0_g3_i1.p4 TRINITY_DN3522_c0_g3~~TRINITY_DN3522_c0_g3_i1.p4  ORF type:complete len:159 (-),score=6.78 TRINITY_DN3522_c0_g3_i1:1429-1905(-)
MQQVATVSANGDKVGEIIAKSIKEVGPSGYVTVAEGKQGRLKHELEIVKGMRFDRGYLSRYLVDQKTMTAELNNAKVRTDSQQKVSYNQRSGIYIERSYEKKHPLLIIAEDIAEEVLSILSRNYIKGLVNVTAVKAPGFGDNRRNILEDSNFNWWCSI